MASASVLSLTFLSNECDQRFIRGNPSYPPQVYLVIVFITAIETLIKTHNESDQSKIFSSWKYLGELQQELQAYLAIYKTLTQIENRLKTTDYSNIYLW